MDFSVLELNLFTFKIYLKRERDLPSAGSFPNYSPQRRLHELEARNPNSLCPHPPGLPCSRQVSKILQPSPTASKVCVTQKLEFRALWILGCEVMSDAQSFWLSSFNGFAIPKSLLEEAILQTLNSFAFVHRSSHHQFNLHHVRLRKNILGSFLLLLFKQKQNGGPGAVT